MPYRLHGRPGSLRSLPVEPAGVRLVAGGLRLGLRGLDQILGSHITHFLLDIRTIRCGLQWPSQVDQCELVSSKFKCGNPDRDAEVDWSSSRMAITLQG